MSRGACGCRVAGRRPVYWSGSEDTEARPTASGRAHRRWACPSWWEAAPSRGIGGSSRDARIRSWSGSEDREARPTASGHAHRRWACPSTVAGGRTASRSRRILAGREDSELERLRRDGSAADCLGACPPQVGMPVPLWREAALRREVGGSSRDARIRSRSGAGEPAARPTASGHVHRRWACPFHCGGRPHCVAKSENPRGTRGFGAGAAPESRQRGRLPRGMPTAGGHARPMRREAALRREVGGSSRDARIRSRSGAGEPAARPTASGHAHRRWACPSTGGRPHCVAESEDPRGTRGFGAGAAPKRGQRGRLPRGVPTAGGHARPCGGRPHRVAESEDPRGTRGFGAGAAPKTGKRGRLPRGVPTAGGHAHHGGRPR